MAKYIATLKVLVEADSQAEACDSIAETLRPAVVDWCYLLPETPVSRYHCEPGYPSRAISSPVLVEPSEPYEEGDLTAMV